MGDMRKFGSDGDPGLEVDPEVEIDVDSETEDEERLLDRYTVVFYNDDVTTFDFVVWVFVTFFHVSERTAWILAYDIHRTGRRAIGDFDYATAINRKYMVEIEARDQGFPLRVEVEPLT